MIIAEVFSKNGSGTPASLVVLVGPPALKAADSSSPRARFAMMNEASGGLRAPSVHSATATARAAVPPLAAGSWVRRYHVAEGWRGRNGINRPLQRSIFVKAEARPRVQLGARRHGTAGIHGNGGKLEYATGRLLT